MMLRRIAPLIAVAVVICGMGVSAGASGSAERAVREVEQKWLENEDNPAVLEQILAEDFVHVLPVGFITKQEHIDFVRKHPRPATEKRKFEELRVRVYGDTGIANGIFVATAPGAGAPRRVAFTDVFVRRGGKWQAVNAQETPLAPAPSAHAVGTESEGTSGAFVPVQSKNTKDLGAGKLLVASRDLGDPNFIKTVVLLVHCDDQGVVGLILNRRTEFTVSRVLEGLQGAKDRSDLAYLGGPVEVPAVFALLQSTTKVEGAEHIFSGVYLITAKTALEHTLAARPDPRVFRVYLGYAGWKIEQLRKEVELGSWFIFPGDTGSVFNSDPDSLWPRMIGKTELKFAGSEPTAPRRDGVTERPHFGEFSP